MDNKAIMCLQFWPWKGKSRLKKNLRRVEYPQELFSVGEYFVLQFLVQIDPLCCKLRTLDSAISYVMQESVLLSDPLTSGYVDGFLQSLRFRGSNVSLMLQVDPPIKASRVSLLAPCWACAFHQDKASSVKVPVANVTLFSSAHLLRENTDSVRVPVRLLGLLALAMAAVCASMAVVRLAISCRMASKVMAGVSDVGVLLGGILST
ncbi:hypothetical protein Tco_1509754 [Tanacetum coccineum]